MKRLLRIDMTYLKCKLSELPQDYRKLGGRGLTSTLISNEVEPLCHPLGNNNKLVIAPGILTGTACPNVPRTSVGGKSPLTGGIKESNCGGTSGQKLARLGIGAIVIEGKPKDEGLHLIHISKDATKIKDAEELRGKGNYELSSILRNKYGDHVGLISIGQAGEMLLSGSSIAMVDHEGTPARQAARGGMGALMGSKGIKAIVIDDKNAPKTVAPANSTAFKEAVKNFTQIVSNRPRVKNRLPIYGTAGLLAFANEVNALPTRNFSTGQFEGIEKISGERLGEIIDERGGERGHACYKGCIVRCSNVVMDKEGKYLTASLEFETLGMLGSNCGIDDLDAIATMDRLCDDYGLDTIEMGGAIGVAMEAGIIPFGDSKNAIKLLKEVGQGTPLGRILGSGVQVTGKVFGVTRVPVVKGQGMPAWDPRTAMGTGLTVMTSPQGADHTAGRVPGIREFDFFEPGAVAPLSLGMQIRVCVMDTVGLCMFSDGTPETTELLASLLSAFYDEDISSEDLLNLGRKVFETERNFNRSAGISELEDRLPEFMKKEPLPPTESLFTVTQQEIDDTFKNLSAAVEKMISKGKTGFKSIKE